MYISLDLVVFEQLGRVAPKIHNLGFPLYATLTPFRGLFPKPTASSAHGFRWV